jgi:hypothetical protein
MIYAGTDSFPVNKRERNSAVDASNAAARGRGACDRTSLKRKRNIVEEEYPSLAGLAATYSSKS